MSNKETPDYKKFEQLVADIQQALSPDAQVTVNEKILGHRSGRMRQVDVVVRQTIGASNILIMIECKDHQRKLDVHYIESIYAHSEDVRANKCIIVSAKGYTEGAKQMAKTLAIDLFSVADTQHHKWRQEIKIPVCYQLSFIESFQLVVSTYSAQYHTLPYDTEALSNLMLYNDKKEPVDTIKNLLFQSPILNNLTNGFNKDVKFFTGETYILSYDNFHLFTVTANIWMENQSYLYQTPVSQIKGFIDEGADNLTIICSQGISFRADLKKILVEGEKINILDTAYPKFIIKVNGSKNT